MLLLLRSFYYYLWKQMQTTPVSDTGMQNSCHSNIDCPMTFLGSFVWSWMAWQYDYRESASPLRALRWQPQSSGSSSVLHTRHPKSVQLLTIPDTPWMGLPVFSTLISTFPAGWCLLWQVVCGLSVPLALWFLSLFLWGCARCEKHHKITFMIDIIIFS